MMILSTSGSVKNISSNTPYKKAEVITVASGKGGVGKTLFSINFAVEAAQMGKKVLIMDGDLGLANVHIMTGIYPDFDLMDVINHKKSIEEVIIEGPAGVHVIPGASGIFQLSNISHQKRHNLVQQLNQLEQQYDLIIVDAEAGISHNVLKFVSIANRIVIVTTPDLTALSDAYATIKVIRTRKSHDNIGVVVNRSRSVNEAEMVFKKIGMATEKFLNFKIWNYGYIFDDSVTVRDSIQNRKPIAIEYTRSKVGQSLKNVICTILDVEPRKVVEQNVILNRFSMLLENIRTKENA